MMRSVDRNDAHFLYAPKISMINSLSKRVKTKIIASDADDTMHQGIEIRRCSGMGYGLHIPRLIYEFDNYARLVGFSWP